MRNFLGFIGCRYVLAVLCALSCTLVHADIVKIVETANPGTINLTKNWSVLEDPGQKLTIADVSKAAFTETHYSEKQKLDSLNYGMRKSAFWLRVTLRNAGKNDIDRWLEISFPQLHDVQFFAPSEQGFNRMATGIALPFFDRPLQHRNFVFPLRLEAGKETTYYLRVASGTTIEIPAKLWEPAAFRMNTLHDYMGQSLYFGMLLALGLYNLLLFFSLRSGSFDM